MGAFAVSSDRLSIDLFCPECGQKLALSVHDLHGEFLCPRCRTQHHAGSMISHNQTLPAIPLGPPPSEPRPDAARAPVEPGETSTRPRTNTARGWSPMAVAPPRLAATPAPAPTTPAPPPWGPPPTQPSAALPAPGAPPSGPEPARANFTPAPISEPLRSEPAPPSFVPHQSAPTSTVPVPSTPAHATPIEDDVDASQTSQAGRALDIAARVLGVISSVCVELDRRLVGKRWYAIVGVSGFGMVLGILHSLDWIPAWPHMLTLVAFVLLVAALAWAQVVVIRFEVQDKGWMTAMRGGFDGLLAMWSSDDGDDEQDELPDEQRSATQRRAWVVRLFAFAVLAYMLASIVGLVPSAAQVAGITQGVAIGALLISVVLWLHGRQADGQTQARKFTTVSTEATEAEFLALPPMVVLDKPTVGELTLAHRATDELLRELLLQLPSWTPGERASEKAYETALVRFLQRRIPSARIEQQVYLTPDGSRRRANRLARIDLVLDGHIAIELKRLESKTELDRCVGQIQDYADLWGDRGPLFLLVCESAPDFKQSATAERLVDAQRRAAFRVLIAGYRRARRRK